MSFFPNSINLFLGPISVCVSTSITFKSKQIWCVFSRWHHYIATKIYADFFHIPIGTHAMPRNHWYVQKWSIATMEKEVPSSSIPHSERHRCRMFSHNVLFSILFSMWSRDYAFGLFGWAKANIPFVKTQWQLLRSILTDLKPCKWDCSLNWLSPKPPFIKP